MQRARRDLPIDSQPLAPTEDVWPLTVPGADTRMDVERLLASFATDDGQMGGIRVYRRVEVDTNASGLDRIEVQLV